MDVCNKDEVTLRDTACRGVGSQGQGKMRLDVKLKTSFVNPELKLIIKLSQREMTMWQADGKKGKYEKNDGKRRKKRRKRARKKKKTIERGKERETNNPQTTRMQTNQNRLDQSCFGQSHSGQACSSQV